MHKHNFVFLLLILFLTGCAYSEHPMGKPLPKLTYDHLLPYKPYGGAVLVRQSAVIGSIDKKNMEEIIARPDRLINVYAQKRFATQGLPVRSVFDVQRISFKKKSDEENIIGVLSGAAADYYTLDLFITLSPVRKNGSTTKPYTIELKRELLIPDNASVAEREMRQFEFLEKIISDVDGAVTQFVANMH